MADNAVTVTHPQTGQPMTVPVPANVGAVCPPSSDMLDPSKYAVNVPNMMEAITQPLYSYQSYPAAGTANPLTFFQSQPVGAITLEDTNMQLAGVLPSPQRFLIQGIAVDFLSGTSVARFGTEGANGNLNDYYAVMKRGYLTLTIGSKVYSQWTSMLQLPPRSHIGGVAAAADASTAAASLQTMVQAGWSEGETFRPRPLLIESTQNFSVNISYPGGAVAIPSADVAARIGVWLYGTLYRPAQ